MPYWRYDKLTGAIISSLNRGDSILPDNQGQIEAPEGLDPGRYSIDLVTLEPVSLPDSPPDSAPDSA